MRLQIKVDHIIYKVEEYVKLSHFFAANITI